MRYLNRRGSHRSYGIEADSSSRRPTIDMVVNTFPASAAGATSTETRHGCSRPTAPEWSSGEDPDWLVDYADLTIAPAIHSARRTMRSGHWLPGSSVAHQALGRLETKPNEPRLARRLIRIRRGRRPCSRHCVWTRPADASRSKALWSLRRPPTLA